VKKPTPAPLDPDLVRGLCADRVMYRPWSASDWTIEIVSKSYYSVLDEEG
jgi:hypothetical protein